MLVLVLACAPFYSGGVLLRHLPVAEGAGRGVPFRACPVSSSSMGKNGAASDLPQEAVARCLVNLLFPCLWAPGACA